MRELQPHELQILCSAIRCTESKREMHKCLYNPEVMISMGVPLDMIREFDTDDLKDSLHRFMDAFDIDEDEYEKVLNFYGKVYAIMRMQVEDEQPENRVQKNAPGIWERRMKFIEDSGLKKGRTRKSLASRMVFHIMEEYDYNFLELNNHNLPENALCYLVSTMSLNAVHKEASARTIDFLWDEMEDSTLYDLYKGVSEFEEAYQKQAS